MAEYSYKILTFTLTVLITVGVSWLIEKDLVKGIGRLWYLLIPCAVLTVFLTPNTTLGIIGCSIWAFESVALIYDLKYMEINDFNHVIPLLILSVCLIKKIITAEFVFSIDMLLPLAFVFLTIRTRGASDTFALIVYCLYGIVTDKGALTILLAILTGYGVQIIAIFIDSTKKHISIRASESIRRPFLPALFMGSLVLFI